MSLDCVLRSLAPAYSLGALDPDELTRFETHLVQGCAVCERELTESDHVANLLGGSVRAVLPPPSLRGRIMDETASHSLGMGQAWSAFLAVGDWQPHKLAGMYRRVLQVDEAAREITMIVRAEAGARYPAHRHAAFERMLMLEGELVIGTETHGAGAFISSGPDSVHPPSVTPNGCMFLIRTSLDDETMLTSESVEERPQM